MSNQSAITLLTAKNIVRPQTFFKDKINNNSNYPWEPRIKEKPNSLKPLAIFLEETENGEEYVFLLYNYTLLYILSLCKMQNKACIILGILIPISLNWIILNQLLSN